VWSGGSTLHKSQTLLLRNAVWLSKQAKKYYNVENMPDIAIFDFSYVDEDAVQPWIARSTWFRQDNNANQGRTFRTVAYLGTIYSVLAFPFYRSSMARYGLSQCSQLV
jgi:hypothetical protein